jgi:hypothetical protein
MLPTSWDDCLELLHRSEGFFASDATQIHDLLISLPWRLCGVICSSSFQNVVRDGGVLEILTLLFLSSSAACMADVTGALLLVLERVRELIGSLVNTNEGFMSYFTQEDATLFWETGVCQSDTILSASRLMYTHLLRARM